MTPSDGFHRTRGGAVVATFTGLEADLLRSLASQLVELLRNETATPRSEDPLEELFDFSGPTNAPEDPVLRRLFPSAYADDDEAAGEFRRFTEGALRDGKAKHAGLVIDALEEAGLPVDVDESDVVIDVEIPPEQVWDWLKAFTDMRLALATRLSVEEGDEERWAALADDDPAAQVHDVYLWLGYLQETLVEVASRDGRRA